MAKYQKYDEYRNTHNQWLTKIPNHWSLVALKHILSVPMTDGPHETPVFLDEGVPFVSAEAVSSGKIDFKKIRGFITEADDKRFSQKYKPQLHDVYMIKSGATTGVTAIVETEDDFNIWSPLAAMRCKKSYDPFFLLNYLRSDPFQKSVQLSWTFGTQQNIGMSTLENLPVCVPPKLEQKKIADFLNYETAKIDSFFEKQQLLIQLLKEKRQAVISHAVTKGLNPNVPMKDSGMEWLGKVPEHWVVSRLKYIKSKESNAFVDGPFGSNLKSEHFIENGDVYVIESNFATTGYLNLQKLKTISFSHFETIERSECRENDIIIAKIGARYGSSAILPKLEKRAVVSGNSLKLTVDTTNCDINYALNLLQHLKNEGAMDDGVNGSAQPALSLGGLNNIGFLTPPIDEQKEITKFVSNKLLMFNGLIEKADSALQLMQERRTALISAAVTGKIDVRNWQRPNKNNEENMEFSA